MGFVDLSICFYTADPELSQFRLPVYSEMTILTDSIMTLLSEDHDV